MRNWFKKYWIIFTLGIIAFLPFSFTLTNPFLSDDWDFLYAAEHKGFSLKEIFSTNNEGNYAGGSYRPMVVVFWRGLYQFFNLNPLPYHIAAASFHVANVILFFILIRKITQNFLHSERISFVSAILFAISPSRAELAWLSAVNDTLSVLCILLTLYTTLLYSQSDTGKKKYLFLLCSLIFTFCAFLTKEIALIIPPAVFFILFFSRLLGNKKLFARFFYSVLGTLPYISVLIVFFVLRYRIIGLLFADYTGDIVLTFYHIARSLVSYTFGFFFSGTLRTTISYYFIQHFKSFVAFNLIILVSCFYILRRSKVFLLSLVTFVLFLFSLVPIIRFGINVTPDYISEEGQRYLYLPSVFLSFFVALVLSAWYEKISYQWRRYGVGFIFVVFVLMYSQLFVLTHRFVHGAYVANFLLNQAKNVIDSGEYDGYVFVGLPEQYRGVPIFRNGFDLALSLSLTDPSIPFTRMIIARNRVLYDRYAGDFLISRINDRSFEYTQEYRLPYISSASIFESVDYHTELTDYMRQPYALSVFDVGTRLRFTLSESFVDTNKKTHNDIALLFFTSQGWKIFPLSDVSE